MGKEQEQNYAAEHSDYALDQISAKSIDTLDTQGLETALKKRGMDPQNVLSNALESVLEKKEREINSWSEMQQRGTHHGYEELYK